MANILQRATESENTETPSDQEKMLKNLNTAFTKLYDRPNTYTLAEFQKYKPLFNTTMIETYSDNYLFRLAKQFFTEINPYKEIQLFQSKNDSNPITTLPPLFMQAASMPSTEEADMVSDKYSKLGRHDVPKYANQAMEPFVNMLMSAQNTDENFKNILNQRDTYKSTMEAFYGVDEATTPTESVSSAPQVNDTDDWDFT